LLDEPERALFRRLAVFSGGCTVEAAHTICNSPHDSSFDATPAVEKAESPVPEIDVFDGLLSLVDTNLIDHGDGLDGALRFRMLETIRAFAAERLAASGEESRVRRSHATYYLSLVTATGALLFASGRKRARQAAEEGNVQAALRWLVEHG
jgi:predicted ATPase